MSYKTRKEDYQYKKYSIPSDLSNGFNNKLSNYLQLSPVFGASSHHRNAINVKAASTKLLTRVRSPEFLAVNSPFTVVITNQPKCIHTMS